MKRAGRIDPTGPLSSGASTSAPGSGRALGRAVAKRLQYGAEPRLSGLFQTAPYCKRLATVSEPETALPLTIGKQGAGAAQRRPRCSASS